MTPYRHTKIKQIIDCLRTCWNDICLLCQDWNTPFGHLSEPERLLVDQTYIDLDLNRNARRLYDLASAPDLLAEVRQGEYSIELMADALEEIERIGGRTENWFPRVTNSEDGSINPFLSHDIYLIRDAIFNVQFIFEPLVRVPQKQVNTVNVDTTGLTTTTALATSAPLAVKELVYGSFVNLFNNPADLQTCVDALHLIRPDAPIISDTGRWQNRNGSKAVLAAWIRRMEDCRKIRFVADKKQLAPLLKAYFPDLNLGVDARTLKDPDLNLVREFAALILP